MTTTDRSIPTDAGALDPEQIAGLADMDPDAFRAAAHRVVDLMADYIEDVERHAGPAGDHARDRSRRAAGGAARGARSRSTRSSATISA